jgi:hypothetical protein
MSWAKVILAVLVVPLLFSWAMVLLFDLDVMVKTQQFFSMECRDS